MSSHFARLHYLREIQETHLITDFTSSTNILPYSLPQSTELLLPLPQSCSFAQHLQPILIFLDILSCFPPTRSTAPEIPTSSIAAPFSETETELSEECEPNFDTPGPSIPSLLPLPFSPKNSSDVVSDTEIILSKCAVCD